MGHVGYYGVAKKNPTNHWARPANPIIEHVHLRSIPGHPKKHLLLWKSVTTMMYARLEVEVQKEKNE